MSNELTVKESYEVFKTEDGKFKRKAVYHYWSSIVAETKEQKIKMFNLLNSDDEGNALGDYVGAQIELADVIFNPYTKIDEDTGLEEQGVLTYLFTPDGIAYVTSSKSVYFSVKRLFNVYGEPHWSKEDAGCPVIEVVKKDGREFKYIDIKLVG